MREGARLLVQRESESTCARENKRARLCCKRVRERESSF